MSSNFREQVTDWLTGDYTCFLFGAGCSVCAGKPMIDALTSNVIDGADEKLIKHFEGLKATGGRKATVEDLINYLVRYKEVLNLMENSDSHDITVEEADCWLTYIRKKIVEEVADNWSPSDNHQRLLSRLSIQHKRRPKDIFILNYDTVLEASLDELKIHYVDGFRGTNRAWFDPKTFEIEGAQASFRLFKLHGSINWTRDANENIRRGHNTNEEATEEPVVVYPSEQKYQQTKFGVFETLMDQFRNRLRHSNMNNLLVVLGYSFNDAHINEAIIDAIMSQDSNLTVIAFVGPDDNRDEQISRFNEFSDRCASRFNAFIGDGSSGYFVGNALDEEAARHVLNAELWKFENIVDLIAKEGP